MPSDRARVLPLLGTPRPPSPPEDREAIGEPDPPRTGLYCASRWCARELTLVSSHLFPGVLSPVPGVFSLECCYLYLYRYSMYCYLTSLLYRCARSFTGVPCTVPDLYMCTVPDLYRCTVFCYLFLHRCPMYCYLYLYMCAIYCYLFLAVQRCAMYCYLFLSNRY
ncbi:PREDICTED: uncharacterized protein LOC109486908 [Branchiostoma belcheri]|uniref:Uncharacterized protein LOC109486908 n=1 Tax=Branchiostoma belcheri TaxID=7741 RepID=A0A6P4ZYZ9_BRABE|nr:PREDICTED: uncharacterized protein LOC109486908 [Branchiostoma belcheri]